MEKTYDLTLRIISIKTRTFMVNSTLASLLYTLLTQQKNNKKKKKKTLLTDLQNITVHLLPYCSWHSIFTIQCQNLIDIVLWFRMASKSVVHFHFKNIPENASCHVICLYFISCIIIHEFVFHIICVCIHYIHYHHTSQ